MTVKSIGAALASALLVASVAGTAVTAEAAPTTSKAAAPIAVTIGASHVVSMPTTIQPGVNEFRVTTEATRSDFQLAQFAAGYTVADAVADIDAGLFKGKVTALKRFEANVTLLGGVSGIRPGSIAKVMLDLEVGTYYAVDTTKNRAGTFTQFSVAGADTASVMPTGETLRATRSTSWAKNPRTIDRKGILTFKNRSSNNHFVGMAKLAKGKTIKDFRAWVEGAMMGQQGPPPVKFDVSFDSGVVSPGQTVAMNYKLPKGNYILACFWPDASMGGMPHAFMGMYRAITLK